MKRGFKSEAERIAIEMREELDLSDDARLNRWILPSFWRFLSSA